MCANAGLKRMLKYHFAANNYLLLSFVHGADEDGILIPRAIVNHPEESFRLQGIVARHVSCVTEMSFFEGKTWRATAAIFYEQYGDRSGHYWACCRAMADKNWYKYNDSNTGDKLKTLPEGLPNIYAIFYQACGDDVIGQNTTHELDWEYIQRILAIEAERAPRTERKGNGLHLQLQHYFTNQV